MNATELERLMRSDGGVPGRAWPPESERKRWDKAAHYRRRYDNDPAQLWPYATHLHARGNPRVTQQRFRDFTPLPFARDIARFSSQLLFSEPPKLTVEGLQPELEAWADFNRLDEFLMDAADDVAVSGSAGLRIIRDDRVSMTYPLVDEVPADRVIWSTYHKRFIQGGIVVVEVAGEGAMSSERYRLLEWHGPGFVRRALFKGSISRLGTRVSLNSRPEFADLNPEERTGLNVPTLIKWDNVPGAHSDVAGLEVLLDAADEAESVFRLKSRASKPLVFVHADVVDKVDNKDRTFFLEEAIVLDRNVKSPAESNSAAAEVAQGKMEADDHARYIEHLREMLVSQAGYSLSSWGLGEAGRADSGRALKLRAWRTLLTRSGKARMAVQAVAQVAGISLALMRGLSEIPEVTVRLGDGMPDDSMEAAREAEVLRNADAASTEQLVRTVHPSWSEEQVKEEAAAIELRRMSAATQGVGASTDARDGREE